MISRIWHGWATRQNADEYERIFKEETRLAIQSRNIPGFHGIELLRREVGAETEFITVMKFESLEAVKQFAGQDYERAVVPPKAQAVLSRFDERVQHYEIISES